MSHAAFFCLISIILYIHSLSHSITTTPQQFLFSLKNKIKERDLFFENKIVDVGFVMFIHLMIRQLSIWLTVPSLDCVCVCVKSPIDSFCKKLVPQHIKHDITLSKTLHFTRSKCPTKRETYPQYPCHDVCIQGKIAFF